MEEIKMICNECGLDVSKYPHLENCPKVNPMQTESKEEPILYVPKREAYKFGYYKWIPQWASYDTRPQRISPLMFTVLSIFPWYKTNPFNGYLVRMNKWTDEKDFSDFVYNPFEKTDALLRKELGFNL